MPTDDAPTMVVVDDHPLWRQTLCSIIERGGAGRVVGEASDAETALELVGRLAPDLVLMDVHLPGMSGVAATAKVLDDHPGTRVLVLSSSDERATVVDAVRAGASGYLLKTADAQEVFDALRRLHRGELVFPPALATFVLDELRTSGRSPVPAPRHVAVVAEGALDREGVGRLLVDSGFDVTAFASIADLANGEGPPDVVVAVEPGRRSEPAAPGGATVVERIREATTARMPVGVVAGDVDPDGAIAGLTGDGTATAPTGYLLRDRIDDVAELGDAVRRVAAGEHVVDPDVAEMLLAHRTRREALRDLTARERDVLQLMAEGRSNQAIAERLFVSGKSVEAHVARIFTKLGLEVAPDDHRRVLAVVAYLQAG